ncbi:MAG TPA: hypothetical protein VK737_13210, partial [Opitutales bacterium]|nr:hypothetical protein [Opitutales bacterium]
GARKPPGPLVEPALLPTPANVKPDGSIRLSGSNLDNFVQLTQTAAGWFVSIAHSDPVPLQALNGNTPSLVAYYSAPAHAPTTQPTVLIYKAGEQPDQAPATGTVSIQRALVLDSQHHLLGDAIWSRVRSDDSQPPLLPAVWAWSYSFVEINDPDSTTPQKIVLNHPAAPAPSATTVP